VAAGAIAFALFAGCVALDPRAEAAFDAPKRLLVLAGVAAAAAARFGLWPAAGSSSRPDRVARIARILLLVALCGACVSALASPRRSASLDALRTVLLLALALPLGASRGLLEGHRRWIAAAFLAGCGANAALTLLQAADVLQPFQPEYMGGRRNLGALVGNEGQLALLLALGVLVAAAALAEATTTAARAGLALVLGLCLGALTLDASLTATTALAMGGALLLMLRLRRRALVPAAAGMLAMLIAVAAIPPLRARVSGAWSDARAGEWDRLLSYRLGPWAAALEMVRERPLVGWGPGSFGAEFVAHRLEAEIRYRQRFLPPFLATAYAQSHSEPLQAAAEVGAPAALLASLAAGLVLVRTARAAWRDPGPRGREAALLAALLSAGVVASLTWFPLQQFASALPLLLAAGRAWSLGSSTGAPA
jgi:putative inorganic carbon (HCO3(-)) transporter